MFIARNAADTAVKIRAGARLAALAAALCGLAATAPAAAQAPKTVTAVMHSGLRVLDPIITTAHITRNHGYMIYDVLVSMDKDFNVRPQMADFSVSPDGLVYTFTLRDNLWFHDGTPVTAADVVASLKRWGERDTGGQHIFDQTESLAATDARTITWKLTKPFGPMLETLGKQSTVPPFIMPERVARTPSSEAITDYTGSGPFRFVLDEFSPGVKVAYAKFDKYVPRDEPADWMAGGKVVKVDRVNWVTMPDAQTAVSALSSGEIDYLEQTPTDLLPILESNVDVVLEVRDRLGYQALGRMNFKQPPFNDKRIRQAALKAMSQEPILAAMVGNPKYYQVCGAVLGCGTPLASEAGAGALTGKGDVEGARALLKEAGYDGSPVVILQPTDVPILAAPPLVAAQQLRAAGFKVDLQPMDWQTLVTRRTNKGAPSQGGWSMFFSYWMVPEVTTPLINATLNARGDEGFFGWAQDPELEAMRGEYITAGSPQAQLDVAKRIQARVMDEVTYLPLGQFQTVQGRRANLVDIIASPVPVFWQMDKK